jgi:RNA polymerase-binding transcription factor DksA
MQSSLFPQQLSRLRESLDARFRELREIIRQELLSSDNEHYSNLAGRVHDLGDESVADLLADINLAVIEHHVEEIREVEAAILRMSAATYGLCVECGDEIAATRLDAYPSASRCLRCQTRRERNYAQPGHATL